ncbi:Uncharacterised protein [BD1-7 clade bacterium]|uniref:Membrane protein FxsA n=1 Tax=BD1-7 clade bacterium TaxID=2029982 RepID=A0A5S9QC81_9GAMM|nr:Uncharacterised protein [BD1-7 clade bacterium]CAA0115517.1 Uncharacterised protein [BD1-7 clade bacterium]
MRLLFPLFLIIPVIEMILLIKVGEWIGVMPTIILVFSTAIIGVTLLRRQGLSTLLRANKKMEQGQVPAEEMVEGMLLAIGGVMLIVPGFFTDFLGLLCLIPLTRRALARRCIKNGIFVQPGMSGSFTSTTSSFRRADEDIIDGEFRRDDQDQIEKK